MQVYDFFTRVPDKATKKYQLKVYDEVILAPMVCFFFFFFLLSFALLFARFENTVRMRDFDMFNIYSTPFTKVHVLPGCDRFCEKARVAKGLGVVERDG